MSMVSSKAPPKVPTAIDQLAYAAGVVDGEGCIQKIGVEVYMARPEVAEWLFDRFGGRLRKGQRDGRPRWIWYSGSVEGSEMFLRAVRPWLILKGQQADRYIAWRESTGIERRLRGEVLGAGNRLDSLIPVYRATGRATPSSDAAAVEALERWIACDG